MNPVSRKHSAASAGPSAIGTPSASSTSADPACDVTARLPCLATFASAAAATSAAPVEILKVNGPPPPVPHVSTNSARSSSVSGNEIARARIPSTNPASSGACSPRVANTDSSAAVSTSLASPDRISPSTAAACSRVNAVPSSASGFKRSLRIPISHYGNSRLADSPLEIKTALGRCGAFVAQDTILSAAALPRSLQSCDSNPQRIDGQSKMKIHEYQAKEILAKYGVAVPKGEVANTLEEANDVARKLFSEGAGGVVVKAQIHAGGRGKGGGVKVAKTREDAELYAKNILGMQLITHQTGPAGQKVQRLLVEETAAIDRELYLGIVLDRATGRLVFMASRAGGMEIEEVAAKTPEAIFKETIDPAVGFGAWQARKLAFALGLKPTQINQAVTFLQSLYKAFSDTDASLVEINPFITTKDDKLFALDAKITFEDNALFRHPDIKALRDVAEEDPLEVEASKY